MNRNKNLFFLPLLGLIIFLVSFIYLYHRYQPKLFDRAYFGSDVWEYQSYAVNLMKGHGYKIGAAEDFSTYRYTFIPGKSRDRRYYSPYMDWEGNYYDYFMQGGRYIFYRAPGYPFFMALIYKIFGIHPRAVQIAQIFLVALGACFLLFFAWVYWGNSGLISGMISAYIFVRYFRPDPTILMAECLLVFGSFLWVLIFIFWQTKPNYRRAVLLGLASALIILIKGINIFVPLFFLVYLFFKAKKDKQFYIQGLVFVLAVIFSILPWSVYASLKSGRLMMLTDQGACLLDSNNEDTLKTGFWDPTWRKTKFGDQSYYYNRIKDLKFSPNQQVVRFFKDHFGKMPIFLIRKVKTAFMIKNRLPNLLVMAGMFLFYYFVFFVKKYRSVRVPVFPLIYLANLILITLIFHGDDRYVLVYVPFFILPAVYSLFLLLGFFEKNRPKISRFF